MMDTGHKPPAPLCWTVKPHYRGGWIIGLGPMHFLKHPRWPTARECVRHIQGAIYWQGIIIDVYDAEGRFFKRVIREGRGRRQD